MPNPFRDFMEKQAFPTGGGSVTHDPGTAREGSGIDGPHTVHDLDGVTNPRKKLYAEGMMGMVRDGRQGRSGPMKPGDPNEWVAPIPHGKLPEAKMNTRQKAEMPANEGPHASFAGEMLTNEDRGEYQKGKAPKIGMATSLYLASVLEKRATGLPYPTSSQPMKQPMGGAMIPPTGPAMAAPPSPVAAAAPPPPPPVMQPPQPPQGPSVVQKPPPQVPAPRLASANPLLEFLLNKSAGPLTPGGLAGARIGAQVSTPTGAQPEPQMPKGNAMTRKPEAAAGY